LIQFRFILWRKVHFLTKNTPPPYHFLPTGLGRKGGRACCFRLTVQQSIDIACRRGPPTAANPPHAATAGEWNRRTDGRTPCRCKDPAAYYATCVKRRTSKKNNSCKNISHFLLSSGADLRVTRVISRPSPWRVSLFYVIIMRVT